MSPGVNGRLATVLAALLVWVAAYWPGVYGRLGTVLVWVSAARLSARSAAFVRSWCSVSSMPREVKQTSSRIANAAGAAAAALSGCRASPGV